MQNVPKICRFLDRVQVPNGYERCSCCYQIFHSLRLCRFSADRNETFHKKNINDNILRQTTVTDFSFRP